jgi:hypothetical protein
MTTKNISNSKAIAAAQTDFIDTVIGWFDGLSPFADNLEISITMDQEELRADLDYGRSA